MDTTHAVHLVAIVVMIVTAVVGMWKIFQAQRRDEAIDAATFLALRELRERFEQTKK